MGYQQPTPGHPVTRGGKPYLYATWVAKMLGGDQCQFSLWFRARFKYSKFEQNAENLVEWNREHTRLMRDRRQELEEAGYVVTVEDENSFKVDGETATVAGKPDLIARRGSETLVVDGKTGRRRDSDIFQVLLYLWAIPRSRPDITGDLEGEVYYKHGNERLSLTAADVTPARIDDLVSVIKIATSAKPPAKSPSRWECLRCTVGPADCPDRFTERPDPRAEVSAGF